MAGCSGGSKNKLERRGVRHDSAKWAPEKARDGDGRRRRAEACGELRVDEQGPHRRMGRRS